ncbi:hypothetical protein ES703_96981 [subsurface metagenome]
MAQTGVATVDLLPLDLQHSFRVYEQLPYFIDKVDCLNAGWNTVVINLDTFNKLSPETQKLFLDTGEELELMMAREVAPAWQEDVIFSAWREAGVHFSIFPDEERVKWVSLLPDIPAEWAAEVTELGYPGWEIVHRFQEITADMGYEWPRTWAVK